jgi:hypothetical protein
MKGNNMIILLGLVLGIVGYALGASAQQACYLQPGTNIRTHPFDGKTIGTTNDTVQVYVFDQRPDWTYVLAPPTQEYPYYSSLGWVNNGRLVGDCAYIANYFPRLPQGYRQ